MRSKSWMAIWAVAAAAWSCGGSKTPGTGQAGPVNGCSSFTDATAPGASRTVTFTFPSYSPPCLLIAAGQSVTFQGSFADHPLQPGVAPNSYGMEGASNPIPSTNSGSTATVAFPDAGTYAYYCSRHFGNAMYGAVQVK